MSRLTRGGTVNTHTHTHTIIEYSMVELNKRASKYFIRYVILSQLRDPLNTGLTRWCMADGGYKYVDAAAEIGRNPVSKHQIQPEREE